MSLAVALECLARVWELKRLYVSISSFSGYTDEMKRRCRREMVVFGNSYGDKTGVTQEKTYWRRRQDAQRLCLRDDVTPRLVVTAAVAVAVAGNLRGGEEEMTWRGHCSKLDWVIATRGKIESRLK